MAIVYILAHLDDEYFATPLIARIAEMEVEQRFLYVADYADPALARRRLSETRAYLARLGVPADHIVHVGEGSGAWDGQVHRHLPRLHDLLAAELARIGTVDRLFVTAWEGGHMDHDACAALAIRLSGGAPVEHFSLYNGPRLPGRLFRAGVPLTENGPRIRVRISLAAWLAFAAGVRCFPSQARTWLGLWPVMFANYLARGFGYQSLRPARVYERPHAGPLLYERMYGVTYAEVAASIRTAWPAE